MRPTKTGTCVKCGKTIWSCSKRCRACFHKDPERSAKIRAGHLGKRHSEETKAKMSAANRGEKNSHWKGGRRLTSNGYRLVLKPNHPGADVNGYVLEHRLAAERILGRPVLPEEVIHHDNRDRLDQRRENLVVCENQGYHLTIHTRHLTPATIDPARAVWLGGRV